MEFLIAAAFCGSPLSLEKMHQKERERKRREEKRERAGEALHKRERRLEREALVGLKTELVPKRD